eukprot:325425_1
MFATSNKLYINFSMNKYEFAKYFIECLSEQQFIRNGIYYVDANNEIINLLKALYNVTENETTCITENAIGFDQLSLRKYCINKTKMKIIPFYVWPHTFNQLKRFYPSELEKMQVQSHLCSEIWHAEYEWIKLEFINSLFPNISTIVIHEIDLCKRTMESIYNSLRTNQTKLRQIVIKCRYKSYLSVEQA